MQDTTTSLPLHVYQFFTHATQANVQQYTQQLLKLPAARKCLRYIQEVDWLHTIQSLEEEKRMLHMQKQPGMVQTFLQSLGEHWISTFENDNCQIRARYQTL